MDENGENQAAGRLIGYARVSTKRQTTEQQIEALRKAGCDPIYSEKMSGKRNDRPELARALADVGPGDTLVVWKLDRLGRDTAQVLTTVKDLRDREVSVLALTDGVNSATPAGRMVMGVLASMAEYELELKQERAEVKRALLRKRGGNLGGRPRRFDAEAAAAIRRAHANGESIAGLARLHKASRQTIYRVLEDAS
ncbi:MAG: recombinase family protein [Gordonia sp. (in: high G+C Gram-positive bacteria)]|uniref:recombinase family protein n=1 Tax=Gordonia sp. (in: high G+C Gram-positive bacteria) TaxID=84139 RepID=UPI0039E4E5C5